MSGTVGPLSLEHVSASASHSKYAPCLLPQKAGLVENSAAELQSASQSGASFVLGGVCKWKPFSAPGSLATDKSQARGTGLLPAQPPPVGSPCSPPFPARLDSLSLTGLIATSASQIHDRLPRHLRPPHAMSSYNYYASPPSSPAASFFPTGPSAPHAFASFHQSPRDGHAMYAALAPSSRSNIPPSGKSSQTNPLKKLVARK
ncbi:uncharacterized protein FIBRA_00131 [Fibroporia radiculosa]|uniref:Uncharacterized protein n=1 Tax=Fibroporia radiculosa TaxID=599839 RepID=J7RGA9_9APHY|nr:uncharacterized protein FIBRA_00131 [Fibroporia radiculosa]CCL98137.1 predicted protein [Fibroporia radiculosa]